MRGPASISHAWRSLRHRNFKLFFAGQSISVMGTWMTRLATSWLVYQMTHSALLLGVVSFSGQILSFLLGPFAGVWVERWERRRMLVWTQFGGALQSLALAALTLTHVITLWEIIALTADAGCDQRVRYAGAAVVPGADGRGQGRPEQCDRAELVDGEWSAAGGAGCCGVGGGAVRRGLVFSCRWRELLCGDRIALADEN